MTASFLGFERANPYASSGPLLRGKIMSSYKVGLKKIGNGVIKKYGKTLPGGGAIRL